MGKASILVVMTALAGMAGCAGSAMAPNAQTGLETLDFREVVRSAKDKVFPAVVFIRVLQESHESGKKVTSEISGSGVIISPDGEVLTNWHVVDKAVQIRCLLFDGRAIEGKVVGSDKDTDLALLKLQLLQTPTTAPAEGEPAVAAEANLPCAVLGSSGDLKEGDFVMAMGAPWGLNRSVSMGIVSSTRRFLPANSEYSLWLQTDASISPGNSGGPLVNTEGEIVGINTRYVMYGGDTGFAVPSDTVAVIVPQLRAHGKVNWSWTGLQLQPLKDFNKDMYFEGSDGVIVAETDPESPARRAGIQQRDRILRVNGKRIDAVWDEGLPAARRRLGLLAKGEPARIELLRDGREIPVDLTPREKGKVEGEELDCPRWDLTVKQINQFDNPDLYFYRKEGVFIYGIRYPGNAGSSGLSTKDIVLKIDEKPVTTLDDVKAVHKAALDNIKTKHRIVFTVLRNGLMNLVVLDFSRDYEKE